MGKLAYAQAESPRPTEMVVVITLDGFPARALKDPLLPMPTLLRLAHEGAASEGMIPINPTVTWPNHTTLITGVDASIHQVMANGLITFPVDGGQPEVKPWTPKDELVHAQTLYDAAAERGLTSGQVNWVAISNVKNVRWQFSERPEVSGAIAKDLIDAQLITPTQIEEFGPKSNSAWRDQIWTDAAVDIIEHHTPDLMLVHLLETDSLQHLYGPLTPAAYASYAYADFCLSRIIEAVRNAGMTSHTTFFVMSDHGFAAYQNVIRPNALLFQMSMIKETANGFRGDIWAQAEGGAAEIFVRQGKRSSVLDLELKNAFAAIRGISGVYTSQEAHTLGIPEVGTSSQAPDLYLTASPNYAFSNDVMGDVLQSGPLRGAHGYDNRDTDMDALFVASGVRVRPGVVLAKFSNLRVAPTIAQILGISLPMARQKPLSEILR
jgi:predicted AlkP superfamily pyrophosphatase or phosphodiesterase